MSRLQPSTWRELERDEHRVLAALEPVDDSTGARITAPLAVHTLAGPAARIVRNHSGLLVLHGWPTLAGHATAFASPPEAPDTASQTLDLRLSDPAGQYLPRDVRLALPRDPDPSHRANADSLFRAARVPLLRASQAPLGGNWAALMVSVAADGTLDAPGDALGGALIEVLDSLARPLARGITDWRGECVLPVVGVPIATWGDGAGAVVVTQINATVRVRWPPGPGTRVPQAQVAAGRAPARLPVIDPDRLPTNPAPVASGDIATTLAAGRSQPLRVVLVLPVPP